MKRFIEIASLWCSGFIAIGTLALVGAFIGPFIGAPLWIRALYIFVAVPLVIGALQRWYWRD